jgi:hypothetical protein
MAFPVTKAVWEHSRSKGNARLVLLALTQFVIKEKLKSGEPALVWPSQQTLADMCGCSRSTVELALKRLAELGEIEDTGERHGGKYRGTVEWEVLPGVDFDLTENESPENRSASDSADDDLTDFRIDLTDFRIDLTDSGPRPDRPVGHKQVVKPVVKPGVEARSSSLSAPDDVRPSPDSVVEPSSEEWEARDELNRLREQLPHCRGPMREQTQRAIDALEAELGIKAAA